jgi:hypothetical protein
MEPNSHTSHLRPPAACIWWQYTVLLLVFLVPGLVAYGITSYFRLSGDTAALRDSVVSSTSGRCSKRLALNVGWATVGLARAGLSFCEMPPEARQALQSVRGGDVALYRLNGPVDRAELVAQADRMMAKRKMARIVGVSKGEDFVAVYMPSGNIAPRNVRCNVLVVHEEEAVIVGARGNLRPIMELVSTQLQACR